MRPVKISTGFPSAAKAAAKLGVSKKVAKDLSRLAERSLKTGEFELPGVGRLIRVHRKPVAGESAAKKPMSFRVVKAARDPNRAHDNK
jgi:hypothetical protein